VFYRRDVFEDQGYDIPATYDELVALSDRILADGSTPWCWAGRWIDGPIGGFPLTDWIEAMLLTGSGPEIYESWVRGDIAFDSGSVRDAFDRLGGLVFPDGYTAGGSAEVPAVDFWTPAFSITEQQPACLMTLATSIISEIVPANRRDMLGMFELPGPDGTTPALLIGGNHWSMAADTPENRAVIEAILSGAHAQVAMRAVGSFVSPDIGFEYSSSNNVYDLGEPSTLQFELGDLIHESIREGRAAWDGADRMPIDFSAGEFLTIPAAWFEEGPAALDQVLHELDAARVAANR
jgi:alpha-glucoside transport system substrate-binding protein